METLIPSIAGIVLSLAFKYVPAYPAGTTLSRHRRRR